MERRPRVGELPGPRAREIAGEAQRLIAPLTQDMEHLPIIPERGEGPWLVDVDGNVFLDFSSGFAVSSLGHAHPRIVEAVKRQAEKLLHFPLHDFYLEQANRVASKLLARNPWGDGGRVLFQSSGAEASEVAMKMAKHVRGRARFLAFYGAFHGRTHGALSLTASKWAQQAGYFPTVPGVVHVPYPNPYRNPWGIDGYEEPGELVSRVISFIEELVFRNNPPHEIAAVFFEPIQGEGGYIIPPRGFFRELRKLADAHGILLVDDEIQMGLGRTGRFWAIEHYGTAPDYILFGKAVGGGLPLSGIIYKEGTGYSEYGYHSSTFGGNIVALAAAEGVREEAAQPPPHVEEMGRYLGRRLRAAAEGRDRVGDVRGLGLAWALEFVKDPRSKDPDPEARNRFIKEAVRRGLILIGCGDSAVRFIPPLNVGREEIDTAMEIVEQALDQVLGPRSA